MTKRVLLTGMGGAIGVHMLAHLMHNTDWHVVGIDSFRHKGEFDRITRVCRDHEDWRERITVIAHDLTVPMTERQIDKLGTINYVINMASLSDVQASIDDPKPFARNNYNLMLEVLDLGLRLAPEVFLHFSTDEVYGPCERESKGHPEWSPIRPSNVYAASKAAQEALAFAYWRSYGLPVVITNTMNNFGETQAPSKYPAKIQKAIAAGEKVTVHAAGDGQIGTRYYIHSRNAADAVLFILENTIPTMHVPGEIDQLDRWNIVGDRQVSNLDLVGTIATLMGMPYSYELVNFHAEQPGHDLHYGLDGTKLARLGWRSPVPFEDSLRNTIEWQARNPEWLA